MQLLGLLAINQNFSFEPGTKLSELEFVTFAKRQMSSSHSEWHAFS